MKLFFYLFLINNIGYHRELTDINISDINDGSDSRITIQDHLTLSDISVLINKKILLDKLKSESLSTNEKLDLIYKYDIFNKKYVDITAGGLFDDFNYIPPA